MILKLEKSLKVEATYEYNDHYDYYGHDEEAYLKATFGDNECLEIHWVESTGCK